MLQKVFESDFSTLRAALGTLDLGFRTLSLSVLDYLLVLLPPAPIARADEIDRRKLVSAVEVHWQEVGQGQLSFVLKLDS